MCNRGRAWLTMASMLFCLWAVAPAVAAAPAVQAARSQPIAAENHLQLDIADLPPAIATEGEYEQQLADALDGAAAALANNPHPVGRYLTQAIEVADLALVRATEPELTCTWLWHQDQAASHLATRALALADGALADARQALPQMPPGRAADADVARIRMLAALLAMEKALLERAGPAEALQAAQAADAAADTVPPEGRPAWQLLLAGCLEKAGRHDDARLRLQRVLRDPPASPQVAAAVLLEARWLAEAGNYPAAVALLSEYLQALPDGADPQASVAASRPDGERAGSGVIRQSLWLLKGQVQREWSDRLSRSGNDLDRQAAGPLREQSLRSIGKGADTGTGRLRLLPILRRLDSRTE